MNGSRNAKKKKKKKKKTDKYKKFQTVAAPAPVQHEDQRQTPWQGLKENYQRDSWFAACLAFADWHCDKRPRCRILGN